MSCTSRLRVLRRISSSARRRSGGAGSAGRRSACADVETGCGMMLTFRRTRHVLRSCGVIRECVETSVSYGRGQGATSRDAYQQPPLPAEDERVRSDMARVGVLLELRS